MGEVAVGGLLLVLLGGVLARAVVDGGTQAAAAGPLPSCAKVGKRLPVPHGWRVPLPPGTVVTQFESGAIRVVYGLVPTSFPETVRWYREDFPRKGFELGNGDAEMDEAEADYSGHGIRGRFRVNALVGCAGASVLTIAAA